MQCADAVCKMLVHRVRYLSDRLVALRQHSTLDVQGVCNVVSTCIGYITGVQLHPARTVYADMQTSKAIKAACMQQRVV